MSDTKVGDPIDTSTGNSYLQEDDYDDGNWLVFRRFYNSVLPSGISDLGPRWRHSFDRSLEISGSPATTIAVLRPDGRQYSFVKNSGVWTGDSDVSYSLTENYDAQGSLIGYTLFIPTLQHSESYDVHGVLQAIKDPNGVGVTLGYYANTPVPLIQTVTDSRGRQLQFVYSTTNQLSQVTLPDGGLVTYGYEIGTGNLDAVQYPDGKTRRYVYNEVALTGGASLPNALTGTVDETGARYESTAYNVSGQATSSLFAGNIGVTQVTYNSGGSATVQYPLGITSTLHFSVVQGVYKVASIDQPCGPQCQQPWKTRTYDPNGNPQTATDFNGNTTATTYNGANLLTQQVDAQGTVNQRTTNFAWNSTLRVPLSRTVLDATNNPISSTQWVYNATGQTLARCEIDASNSAATGYACTNTNTGTVPAGVQRWTYTYCTTVGAGCPLTGLLLTTTGPRTDLIQTTTYSYYLTSSATNCGTPGSACYQPGDLHTVTDAAGHVTTIASYDGAGRITRLIDANGLPTDLTYTPRGWLASRNVNGQLTRYTYTPYGAVQTITDPDGLTTTYGYDPAHRLTSITDALGNTIQYTLDAAGNKTAEQINDAAGTLHKRLTRSFNTLGQLTQVMDGLNHTVFDASASGSYDANGNLVQSADGLGIARQQSYDALNRLVKTLDNYNGSDSATRNTTTQYTYDSLDRLTQLTDPSNLATTYSYDGLGNATGQHSPDTGTTARSFDAAGNVLTQTDAKGITATTTYDALNRPLTVSYPDSTQTITYAYDEANSVTGCSASAPIGRLTRIIESNVTTVYCYDAWGRVSQKQAITASATRTTSYTYSAAGRLLNITYPSGSQLSYTRDGDGRIQTITATPPNGIASTVVSNVTYLPFGPASSYTLGNGQVITRNFDANYRLTDLTSPAFDLHVARDAMGNITAIGNTPGANPATETYTYDPLYRLLSVVEADGSTLESVTYNPTGDRLSKAGSGLATGVYSYNPGTHQLIATGSDARSVDANGNTTALTQAGSTYGFGYNQRDRLSVAQLNQSTMATYTYNADNERIAKNLNGTAEGFDYDEDSQLLAEYGATNRDYIWMDGIPVANIDIQGTTSTITYVTADYLGTPRAVADSSGSTLWQLPYQGNPWSEAQPTSNGYVYNFRLPGQYYDAETGWNYNVNRFYEPSSGRYGQADPLGWAGGQWSLYAYVGGNPLNNTDPLGLASGPMCQAAWEVAGAACGGVIGGGLGALGGGVIAGGACTLVAPGAGTVGCGAIGASSGGTAGAGAGSVVGGAVGSWLGGKMCNADDSHHDDCREQWISDTKWCDNSFKGRKNVACHAWAKEELLRCLDKLPRQPFRL